MFLTNLLFIFISQLLNFVFTLLADQFNPG